MSIGYDPNELLFSRAIFLHQRNGIMAALDRYPKMGPAGVTPASNQAIGKGVTTMDKFVPVKRIILLIDLAGFAKASQTAGDAEIVAFLQDYYAACEEVLNGKDGTVVKFMGDACLATFQPDARK